MSLVRLRARSWARGQSINFNFLFDIKRLLHIRVYVIAFYGSENGNINIVIEQYR